MKWQALSIAALFFPLLLSAQTDTNAVYVDTTLLDDIQVSAQSMNFHKYRVHLSYPPYGSDKVNELIRKQVVADQYDNLVMKSVSYTTLSLREKFTYNMLHAEEYSQNCDAMPPVDSEQVKIFAYLPDAFSEFTWSERQVKFFTENRDSVLALMKECIAKNKRVGINFKQAILEMNAIEMIPVLISNYQLAKKDNDILTLLMLLMKEGKFPPFLGSVSYTKLYGPDSNYQGFLRLTKANCDLVIKRATEFYDSSKH